MVVLVYRAHCRRNPGGFEVRNVLLRCGALRAMLLESAPSIDLGEVTDKGSINQRAVPEHRTGLVEALYAQPPGSEVIGVAT